MAGAPEFRDGTQVAYAISSAENDMGIFQDIGRGFEYGFDYRLVAWVGLDDAPISATTISLELGTVDGVVLGVTNLSSTNSVSGEWSRMFTSYLVNPADTYLNDEIRIRIRFFGLGSSMAVDSVRLCGKPIFETTSS